MTNADAWSATPPTAALVLADGTVIEGHGLGATGSAAGEVCFNTAITGYQEILTDPSYAGQIITFTFPHIGNIGANDEDVETVNLAGASGRARRRTARRHHGSVKLPRNARARRLAEGARHYRHRGHRYPRAHRPHPRKRHAQRGPSRTRPTVRFDFDDLKEQAKAWPGLEGHGSGEVGHHRAEFRVERDALEMGRGLRPPGRTEIPRGGHRLRDQAQHPAASGRSGLSRHRAAGNRHGAGSAGARSRRRVPVERPRRPRRDRRIRAPDDPRGNRLRYSGVRHLSRPSTARTGARRQDPKDASGPPRREPSGHGPHDRQGSRSPR